MKTENIQKQKQQNGISSPNTAELIQKRAYERYLARGKKEGHELEDWLLAEQDVRAKK